MLEIPDPGLYRTTEALPGNEQAFPKDALVFLGQAPNGGSRFVVRPGRNQNNRWYWGEPTTPLRSPTWASTLKALRSEGFYTLPERVELDGGGYWLQNAIVQLGYNEKGQGIIFVGQRIDDGEKNILEFSNRGIVISDDLLSRLAWAPILPVKKDAETQQ